MDPFPVWTLRDPFFPFGFASIFGPRPLRTANIGAKSGQDHQHKLQERPKTANRGPKIANIGPKSGTRPPT